LVVLFFTILCIFSLKIPLSVYGLCVGSCGCEYNLVTDKCQVKEDVDPCPTNFKCETWKVTGEGVGVGSIPFICNSKCVPVPSCDPGTGNKNDGVITAIGCIPMGSLNSFAGWILSKVVFIASGIAFLLMAFGAFQVITSAGDPKKAQAGKELITSALSGLLFIILSIFLLKLIGVDILHIPGF